MQFRIRSLLVLTTLAAIMTMPTYRYSVKLYEEWHASKLPEDSIELPEVSFTCLTGSIVPEGGSVILPDGKVIKKDAWE